MKVIIAGSRSITNFRAIEAAIANSGFEITEVISGGARGADLLGERWANMHHIPVRVFSPNWGKYGNRAGVLRNAEMVEYADALIAVWDGASAGTRDTIKRATMRGMPVHVHNTY